MTRESKYWLTALVSLLVIYSTLGVVRPVAEWLRGSGQLRLAVASCFVIAGVALAVRLVRGRPSAKHLLPLGVVLVLYGTAFQLFGLPEERLHLLEYGWVGGLFYRALQLRLAGKASSPSFPAICGALVLTLIAGWIDEGIQALLPSRYYDLRDVGFNLLAGALAVITLTLMDAVRRDGDTEPPAKEQAS